MATTLPRPSRPSCGPPNTPLPSLRVPKSRQTSVTSVTSLITPESRRSSAASLQPSAPAGRAVSSSALPTRPQNRAHPNSTSSVPVVSSANGIPPPARTLRKTISIGSFPQPPRTTGRVNGHPSSPLSTGASPVSPASDGSSLVNATDVPPRDSSMRRKSPRLSQKGTSSKSPLGTPSLQSGNGKDKSVVNNGLLSLPSPPQSRTSSAQGSYANSATTFEDIDEADVTERKAETDKRVSKDESNGAKDGKGNVIVSVRVRPDIGGQDVNKSELEWMVDGRRSSISYRGREGGEYLYDNVFTTHDNNAKVYDAAAKRLVRRVMEGYTGVVFAYGMTGTGKTFSMQGTATSPGVIPLAITDIFSFIRETPHREFLLRVSYLEIYNEKLYDLLSNPAIPGPNGQVAPQEEIKLREDSKRGVYATPLKEEIVQSPTQLLRVIARGDNARRTGSTQFNARSSRSHAVVQIVIESRERVPGNGSLQESKRAAIVPGGVRVSTLSLIDLAGSEKAAENKERRTEGAHINKSLLTLGTVIARLSSDKDKQTNGADKDKHLPYRDSKLTRLLQPALSGNSLVSILCTIQIGAAGSIATANNHTGETLNTLKFAARAKNNIVSHAKKAEEAFANGPGDAGSRALLDRYRMEIVELRKQLENQNRAAKEEEEEKAREIEAEQRHEEQMLEMQLARTALKERIEHLNRLILSSKSIGVNSGRSFSSLSLQRSSLRNSGNDYPVPHSARSSASHATLGVASGLLIRAVSADSATSLRLSSTSAPIPAPNTTAAIGETASEEDDSLGENGDGTASYTAQIRALQADLADKNRYISTLEKRLLQARRSSQSRPSLGFVSPHAKRLSEDGGGGVEALLREKDAEIADLRARLGDKDRMVAALRSAARKRDVADLNSGRADTAFSHRSHGSNASSSVKVGTISPVALLAPKSEKRGKSVDEMTRMLDEMITERTVQERVDSGVVVRGSRRSSLRVVSESR